METIIFFYTHHSEQFTVNTHTINTHPEQWAAIYAAVEQLEVQCLAQGHLGRGVEGGESAVHSPPPTIPAGPRLKLATFVLRVQLSIIIRPRLPLLFNNNELTSLLNTCNININQDQWSQTQFLEGRSSAQFSSNQLQHTPAWKFSSGRGPPGIEFETNDQDD